MNNEELKTPPTRDEPRCENCDAWTEAASHEQVGGTAGQCRRLSPVLAVWPSCGAAWQRNAAWPRTLDEDWCLEFRVRRKL